jgi:hypothetical protein
MTLRLLLLLSWLLLALPGRCQDVFQHPLAGGDHGAAFAQLAAAMKSQSLVQGAFTQTKHLQMLERPLVTRGSFTLSPERFEWRIEHPFTLAYSFADQRLTRETDGGRQTVQPAAEPALFGFFSFFSSLFSLSQSSLEKLFAVYFLPSEETWELGLTPLQPQLATSIRQLHISGSETRIHQVRLTETSGDITDIQFSYPPQTPVAP